MNAEVKSLLFRSVGEVGFGTGAAGAAGAAGAEDHPPKSSLLNKSAGIAAAGFEAGFEAGAGAGLGAGGEAGVAFCVKEKSSVFLACGAGAGCGAGGLVGVLSKKLPPLSGGGDET